MTRHPKQLSSTERTNILLKLIAEHDARYGGDNTPNESWTFRRIVHEEAKRLGIKPPTTPSNQSTTRTK